MNEFLQNILLQSPQGVKYCVNCEEIEKDYTSVSEPQQTVSQGHLLTPGDNNHLKVEMNYQHAECVLLTKLQDAVSALQESNCVEITIHQCQVIKACSEALMAIRKLAANSD